MDRIIEAVYEDGVLRPLERLDLPNGARVLLRIEGVHGIYGILRGWEIDPQKLKDELRGLHG